MCFNPLEYLEQGKVDFMYHLTNFDYNHLVKLVRNSERRKNIIDGFLPILKTNKYFYRFCFEIVYDMEEYKADSRYLIKKCFGEKVLPREYLINLLDNCSLGYDYLKKNFDLILLTYQNDLNFIFDYLFNHFDICKSLLKKLSIYSNLHIRFLFMKYLVKNKKDKITFFYDDITKYLTSVTYKKYEQTTFLPVFMRVEDISELAYTVFEANNYELYKKFKEFILKNYKYNNLGHFLIKMKEIKNDCLSKYEPNLEGIEEFYKDADTYFKTAATARVQMYKNYSNKISLKLLQAYKKQLSYFQKLRDIDDNYEKLDRFGLTRLLEEYVSKYLDLSHNKTCRFIAEGTTASCYKIGEYAFKLVHYKYSREKVICPDLYLILPNLEEVLLRKYGGAVTGGIEVQKFLRRSAQNIPGYVITEFKKELARLGYYSKDNLIYGDAGDNAMLLDDYHDAGIINVPEWFKKYPLVLVDHDLVYKIHDNLDNPINLH